MSDDLEFRPDELREYTTVEGRELRLRPVPNVLQSETIERVRDEFHDRGEPIDRPTGLAKTIVGEEEYTLTADNLERPNDPEGTARNKSLWAAHQEALERLHAEIRKRVTYLLLYRGVVLEEPEPEGWAEELEDLGFSVPEDRIERRVRYLETEVLTSMQDINEVISRVQSLTSGNSLPARLVRAAQASFRGQLPEGRRPVDAAERVEPAEEPLAAQPAADRAAGG